MELDLNKKDYIIITNNPKVKESYSNIKFVDGTVKDVFDFTRKELHQGKKLLTHPLGASLKMLHSPYRSIIISSNYSALDIMSIELLEHSILKYKQHTDGRTVDVKNEKDYSFIDLTLLNSACEELLSFI
ncbi:GrdX family protein [uncultured Cetobacterium sp.]|uniref:GrdX family protein n=1 Tax=uncultured Cetobacterium sp. TaxID=527638 RepID=UPI0026132B10|nr:GrdX family protein [uncultured Cetobacterium sp.]